MFQRHLISAQSVIDGRGGDDDNNGGSRRPSGPPSGFSGIKSNQALQGNNLMPNTEVASAAGLCE